MSDNNKIPKALVTRRELNSHDYPLTPEQSANFEHLYLAINKLRELYGKPMIITSGVRTIEDQKRINPRAMGSAHTKAAACDIADPDGALDRWCLDNLPLLTECGLYLEDPSMTPRWTHLQVLPPRSGNRVFVP